MDQFTRGPDVDSKESETCSPEVVEYNKVLLCFGGICISLLLKIKVVPIHATKEPWRGGGALGQGGAAPPRGQNVRNTTKMCCGSLLTALPSVDGIQRSRHLF